ncbi:MAG TPA: glycosyltransferase [Solirubrobacteraceae bacterium]|nr:glycosyltransferase [Solirubrobacteraceae bacterium]
MPDRRAADVLIVSLGSTEGLRRADIQLLRAIEDAGVSAELASAAPPPPRRTLMATDLVWARAARRAALEALRGLPRAPRAVIYSSTTAALLWPRAGAIRFDATASANRPGRHGLWQRPLERRRLAQAPLLLPWSEGALAEAPAPAREGGRALVLPVAVEPSGPGPSTGAGQTREIAALTYAANPRKKGLDRVLEAWLALRAEMPAGRSRELLVAGTSAAECAHARIAIPQGEGIRLLEPISSEDYRALVRRARVFVCAPRREDYGIAQLEALADGCQLVTTPAPGPYAALPIARSLDARLVGEDLLSCLRAALLHPSPTYSARAADALAPFRPSAVDRLVAEELLPRLLA